MERYQIRICMLVLACLTIGVWSCSPDEESTCDQHSDCGNGYLCDLDKHECYLMCTDASECYDNNVCTDDICPASGICEYAYNTDPCDDELFCNGEDQCNGNGVCGHVGDPCGALSCNEEHGICMCSQHSDCQEEDYLCDLDENICVLCLDCITCDGPGDCDDDNPCTTDICPTSGICVYEYNQDSCDDGIACNNNIQDVCDGSGNCTNPGEPCEEWIWKDIAAGTWHTCGIIDSGMAYCWGEGSNCSLGHGEPIEESQIPIPVAGNILFKQIVANGLGGYSCGIADNNKAYCWGSDVFGQLGDGGSIGFISCTPVEVSGDRQYILITAGYNHVCAIATDEKAYCWGSSSSGELGSDTQENYSSVPLPVAGNLSFSQISAGVGYTCGITTDDKAYCWGIDSDGQLGNGTEAGSSQVPSQVQGEQKFIRISAGRSQTCGITTDNKAYCWGDDSDGQLGNGTEAGSSQVPSEVEGNLSFTEISTYWGHTCGITISGETYCWGSDSVGQLGNGGENQDSQTPVLVQGNIDFVHITAGWSYACGISSEGRAYCWGCDGEGQLGNGSELYNSQVPVIVDTSIP